MTKRELNRDVRRLAKLAKGLNNEAYNEDRKAYFELRDKVRAEVVRLHDADKTFKSHNKDSIITLMRLNHSLRVLPLHVFGLFAGDTVSGNPVN